MNLVLEKAEGAQHWDGQMSAGAGDPDNMHMLQEPVPRAHWNQKVALSPCAVPSIHSIDKI